MLARGDRRDYVILDHKGGIHSLARRIDGMKVAGLREFMAPMNPDSVPTIDQAREMQAERERRLREAKESHADARVEAAYARGDDYVSQTQAALKDHKRRQRDADDAAGRDNRAEPAPPATPAASAADVEMDDVRRKRLDRIRAAREAVDAARDHTEDDPSRQHTAPGGGHTRSR